MEIERRIVRTVAISLVFVFECSCQEDSTTLVGKLPMVTTAAISEITQTTATGGGEVTSEGGAAVSERGVCWSTNANPTVTDSKTASGSGMGLFVSSLTALTANTTYHVRAYATNKTGTAYGNDVSFTTAAADTPTVPILTTTSISSITQNSAASGGNITGDGGSTITARGICWNTNHNPTISNNKTSNGVGTGSYTSALTSLTANTAYYVRAYATNANGTAYGNEISFVTAASSAGNTMTDADGNTYDAVTIGTQVWITENLKTTKYNDGTAIANITDDTAWQNDTNGAYSWYNNDAPAFKNVYGALYNWYAVNTGKVCPVNWHVPTESDWTTLENYLIASGYNYDGSTDGNRATNNKIAKSLADTVTWDADALPGTPGNTDYSAKRDAAGFNGQAGGYRNYSGVFVFEGRDGGWWTSSEIVAGATTVWSRWINASYVNVLSGHYDKFYGFSVRCVKN